MRYYSSESYYRLPQTSDTIFRIIAVLVAGFLLQWIATLMLPAPLSSLEFASSVGLQFNWNFRPTQLLTHILYQPDPSFFRGLFNLFFICLVPFFFGSELERSWGSYNFLKFFFLGLAGGAALALVVTLALGQSFLYYGISAGNAAILVAYALLWPDRRILFMFLFPIRMRWFIPLIFILLAISGGISTLVLYSGGALAGALWLYYYARRGGNSHSIHSQSFFSSSSRPRFSLRERYQKYQRKRFLRRKQAEIDARIAMKEEVDRILDKISRKGMKALNRREKAFLDRASHEF